MTAPSIPSHSGRPKARTAECPPAGAAVVTYSGPEEMRVNEHDRVTHHEIARRTALLLGLPFAGAYRADRRREALFFVPSDTLLQTEAAALGIVGECRLYGGITPHRYVATKAISHGLVAPDAQAPPGWQHRLGALLETVVLRGVTAFHPADAAKAGRDLLVTGPVRLKPVRETGGRGQSVIRSIDQLDRTLAALDAAEMAVHGLVIEENLVDVITFSVGTTILAGERIAYWGQQRVVAGGHGRELYGGSDLLVLRGGFDALLAADLDAAPRRAVELARDYDDAAFAAYPGLIASRRNYDVIAGADARGRRRFGVLEQSWRVGGASGAEIAAFEAFRSDPGLAQVETATVEIFGDGDAPPAHAAVYYRGTDPIAGPVTKYAVVKR